LVVRDEGVINEQTAHLPFFRIQRQQVYVLLLITNPQVILTIDPIAVRSLEAQPFLLGVFVGFFE
jgi:hypothetical protein